MCVELTHKEKRAVTHTPSATCARALEDLVASSQWQKQMIWVKADTYETVSWACCLATKDRHDARIYQNDSELPEVV